MLNMERDTSNPGQTYPVPGADPQREIKIHNLTPQELKMYKDCVSTGYYKTGIPFAILVHLIANRKKPVGVTPGSLIKSGFLFLGNVLLGSLFYTPVCYIKLAKMRAENLKREKELDLHGITFLPEETQSKSQVPDDYSYPIDLITNLNEPDSNYTGDIDSSSRLLHDDDKDNKAKSMTYDDLRAKHRSRFTGYTPPASSFSYESDFSSYSSPSDKGTPPEKPSSAPPPRKVRNKYGDEIE